MSEVSEVSGGLRPVGILMLSTGQEHTVITIYPIQSDDDYDYT